MTIKAKRSGKCPRCKKQIEAGDPITISRGQWVCAECAANAEPAGPRPTPEEVTQAKATLDAVVGVMLGRGAPVQYDDRGFNKPDHGVGVAWADGTHRGRPYPSSWVKMGDRLHKYRRQLTSLEMWDKLTQAREVLGRWAEWDGRDRHGHQDAPQGPGTGTGAGTRATAGKPASVSLVAPGMRPTLEDRWGSKWVAVRFPYDADLVAKVKALPKRRWDQELRAWLVPLGLCGRVSEILRAKGDPTLVAIAEALFDLDGVGAAVKETEAALGLARAVNGDAAGKEGAAVVQDVDASLAKYLPAGLTLYPFQSVGVGFLHANKGRAIVADEMGTGKTIQALAFLLHEKAQGRNPFPAVVVCPAVVKLNWEREANKWLANLGIKVHVCNGNVGAPADTDVAIINFDLMPRCVKIEEVKEGRSKVTRIKDVVGLPAEPATVIVDESHKIKNPKAKRTKATSAYALRADRRVFLSGTPMLNRPIELFPTLACVRPDEWRSFFAFAKRYAGAYKSRWGWNYQGASNLDELRNRLHPIMLRRKKEDVLTELPPKRRARLTLDLSNRAEYQAAEEDVVRWLEEVTRTMTLAEAEEAGLTGRDAEEVADAKAEAKGAAAMRAKHLVRMNALRKLAGVGKVKAACEWIADLWEADEDRKLIVWAHHKDVVAEVMSQVQAQFPDVGIVSLTGDTTQAKRQEVIDAFQSDPNVKLYVGTTTAGGIGITLTAASDCLFLEREWVPGDEEQAEDRAHRIGQSGPSVTCWYAEAEATIDHDFAELVEGKRMIAGQVIDGNKPVVSKSRIGEITRLMVQRHGIDPMEVSAILAGRKVAPEVEDAAREAEREIEEEEREAQCDEEHLRRMGHYEND